MRLSLSTGCLAPQFQNGFEMLEAARDLGFSAVELGHNTVFSLWPGIQRAVREKVVKVCSVHNFCPVPVEVIHPSPNCYQFTAASEEERRHAIKATFATIEAARELEAEVVVLHLGSMDRKDHLTSKLVAAWRSGELYSREVSRWKREAVVERRQEFPEIWSRLRECLDPVVEEAQRCGIKLGAEFRCSFEEFPNPEEFDLLFETYPAATFGYWHDFGHAGRMEALGWVDHGDFLKRQMSRLIGAHVQDFNAPVEDHLPLGHGKLNFTELVKGFPKNGVYVLEVEEGVSPEDLKESIKQWNSYVGIEG